MKIMLHGVRTGAGAHSASHPLGTGCFPPEVRRQEREADHLLAFNAEVKRGGAMPSLPYTYSKCGA
jgi:hypothetical protein